MACIFCENNDHSTELHLCEVCHKPGHFGKLHHVCNICKEDTFLSHHMCPIKKCGGCVSEHYLARLNLHDPPATCEKCKTTWASLDWMDMESGSESD